MSEGIDIEAVQRFRCFTSLSDQNAAAVARNLERVRLGQGEVLFREGSPGETAYFLVSGRLEQTNSLYFFRP